MNLRLCKASFAKPNAPQNLEAPSIGAVLPINYGHYPPTQKFQICSTAILPLTLRRYHWVNFDPEYIKTPLNFVIHDIVV